MHGFYPTGKDDPDGASENLNTGIAIVARINRVRTSFTTRTRSPYETK
jgi:hypothetical protein